MDLNGLLIFLAIGAVAGWLAGVVFKGGGFGLVGNIIAGVIGGWALTHMIVKVLTGVFDPPPTTLAIPWSYLLAVLAAAIAAVSLAINRAVRGARRPAVEMLRDI